VKPLDPPTGETGTLFLAASASKLRDDFLPRLERALQEIPDDRFWQAGGEHLNSVGNLLLHLSGNLRQWVISGIGGEPDVRVRDEEFSRHDNPSRQAAVDQLRTTVEEACDILEGARPAVLTGRYTIQGYDVSGLEVIYHTVEHFSYHLGQIIQTAKQIADTDLKLYPF